MKRLYILIFNILIIINFSIAQEKKEIIVSKDGSGDFTSIQEAINSIPDNNKQQVIIFIKNGIYREKIFIQNSHITLIGEDRKLTKIIFPELRENWTKEHNGSDWGTAVINIDTLVSDIIFANMTIYNNYGSIYDVKNKHQFAVRGWGTRIIFIYCDVISDGGDTMSLWNKEDGMYYHSNCYFEGWVDFVCPRGWCYITDSRFFGYNLSASIWHDGDTDKDQKFVIRYSYFDGVPNFPLGRHHRDAQIYLLDCIFSKNMADKKIYYPTSPTSRPWKWGERHYFYNCHREGGDYDWFKDNLELAEGSPKPEEIDAKWTFKGKWDPESHLNYIMPYSILIFPRNGAYYISNEKVILRWAPARKTLKQRIFFGTDENNLNLIKEQEENYLEINKLEKNKTYYWRVDGKTEKGIIKGELWHFTTR